MLIYLVIWTGEYFIKKKENILRWIVNLNIYKSKTNNKLF